DLPWRRTHDPYAIWVSEIMLQQTQVKTVIPFWERWMHELPTIESAATASSAKIHKLWEGLGYYTRVRNLQKAAQQIKRRAEFHDAQNKKNKIKVSRSSTLRKQTACEFPKKIDDVIALSGIGRYTAGAICSIAFNQPTPILDGNVIRVLTRIFGIVENPKEKQANTQLWQLAAELVYHAKAQGSQSKKIPAFAAFAPLRENNSCSFLNQSLMELGALVCTPRNPQCLVCPVKKLCVAFKENCVDELPNLGKRQAATARTFFAFVIERDGKFLVQQRPVGIVNAHLWEFPNFEMNGKKRDAKEIFDSAFDFKAAKFRPFGTVKHSITRYRMTLEAFRVHLGGRSSTTPKILGTRGTRPSEMIGIWKTPAQMEQLAFSSAHKKILVRLHE
ncbi:MAG TPA: A/G-specific adenine glycosylase, partial [Verrucomicrobiae bacterium]